MSWYPSALRKHTAADSESYGCPSPPEQGAFTFTCSGIAVVRKLQLARPGSSWHDSRLLSMSTTALPCFWSAAMYIPLCVRPERVLVRSYEGHGICASTTHAADAGLIGKCSSNFPIATIPLEV